MAEGSTIVRYGYTEDETTEELTGDGITMWHCRTEQFAQYPVRDEAGNLMYWRFVITVSGLLHDISGWESYLRTPVEKAESLAESKASKQHIAARSQLPPRRRFEMRVGYVNEGNQGNLLIKAYSKPPTTEALGERSNQSYLDVNNGPVNHSFAITHIVGDTTYRIQATFEVCLLECDTDGTASSNSSDVLSNVWSWQDSIDGNWMTTRVHSGVLRTSHPFYLVNDYRSLCMPPLQMGMKRKSITFKASTDGLFLNYTVVDAEVMAAAPHPASDMSYNHTQSTQDSLLQTETFSLTLSGGRDATRVQLVQLAVAILLDKILGGIAVFERDDKDYAIVNFQITDSVRTGAPNTINLTCTTKRKQKGNIKGVAANDSTLGHHIRASDGALANYDYRVSASSTPAEKDDVVLGVQGVIPTTAHHCVMLSDSEETDIATRFYFQEPCSSVHDILNGSKSSTAPTPSEYVETPAVSVETVESYSDSDNPYISQAQITGGTYTFWKCQSLYQQNELTAMCPTNSGDETGNTATATTLGSPVLKRTLRIEGERIGDYPKLPDPKQLAIAEAGGSPGQAASMKLLKTNIISSTPRRSATGGEVYHVHAEYIYGMLRPYEAGDSLAIGYNPHDEQGYYSSGAALTGGGTELISGETASTVEI